MAPNAVEFDVLGVDACRFEACGEVVTAVAGDVMRSCTMADA